MPNTARYVGRCRKKIGGTTNDTRLRWAQNYWRIKNLVQGKRIRTRQNQILCWSRRQIPKSGVYQDELGDYIVYKNKADGTRVIRYQGPDEEFAVHELYQRFLEEIINQQTRWAAGQTTAVNSPIYSFEPESRPVTTVHILLFIVIAFCSYFFTLEFLKWLQNSKGINLGVIVYMAPIVVMAFALLSFRAYILNQSLRQSFNSILWIHSRSVFHFGYCRCRYQQ